MNVQRLVPRLILFAGVGVAILWAGLNRDRLDPAVLDVWLAGLGIWAPVAHLGLYAAGNNDAGDVPDMKGNHA